MKSKCCRSVPRCAACPARIALAAALSAGRTSPTAQLVGEALAGSRPRALPPSVQQAMRDLDDRLASAHSRPSAGQLS